MIAWLMGLETVDPASLLRQLEAGSVSIFDLNSPASWREAHLPGARRLEPEAFSESDLPSDRGRSLIFYCSNPLCRKAPRAALRARKMGYREVRVLSAGISGWLSAGYPTESGAGS